jgi:DNA-binding transcriptional MerR regulator
MNKDDGAFLTIGELARELGVAQHILRYWETRFPQLRPLQRTGNRRYYRPRDVEIARQIKTLLNEEGFTVRGAQRLLSGRGAARRAGEADVASQPDQSLPAKTAAISPATVPPSAGAAPQGELPISEPPAASVVETGQDVRHSGQIGASDLALLIARLTVIRQNLRDAIGEE